MFYFTGNNVLLIVSHAGRSGDRGGERKALFKAFPEVDILAGVSFREFGDVKEKKEEKGNNG